jgi:hypothetical protein
MPKAPREPTSETGDVSEHVCASRPSMTLNALKDETGVLPIKTEAITKARIVVMRMTFQTCTEGI